MADCFKEPSLEDILRKRLKALADEWEAAATVDMQHPIGVLATAAKQLRAVLATSGAPEVK